MMPPPVVVSLSVVIAAVDGDVPHVLITRPDTDGAGLPSGPFKPAHHRTFELGLREWVRSQTGFDLGYVEQLYTFGDRGRHLPSPVHGDVSDTARRISVSYLGLTPERPAIGEFDALWRDWYRHFPWEDHRSGPPPMIAHIIAPALADWAERAAVSRPALLAHQHRTATAFGLLGHPWLEDDVLARYELLYEAGLVPEAARDDAGPHPPIPGEPMISDHRRILATAAGRLRGKLKYRPIAFKLLPPHFTLSDLQKRVEAILGLPLHTQNFRRALDRAGFVERVGVYAAETGGRPAELYRYAGTDATPLRGGIQTPAKGYPRRRSPPTPAAPPASKSPRPASNE